MAVKFSILGASGGTWCVESNGVSWDLRNDGICESAAQVTIDELIAWRMFTKSISRDELKSKVTVEGDENLALLALDTISIIG